MEKNLPQIKFTFGKLMHLLLPHGQEIEMEKMESIIIWT